VSPHNPKTLRASAGSLFRVPFLHGVATATAVATLRQNGVKLFAAMPPSPLWSSLPGCHDPIPGGIPPAPPIPFHHPPPASATSAGSLAATDLTCRCALIVGNEARGVSAVWRTSAAPVSIPTVGVESLNAAIAAAILLYEARRQRMSRP
jgi:TrmH family RNA methyltransferase